MNNEQNIYKSENSEQFREFKNAVEREYETIIKMNEDFLKELSEEEENNRILNNRIEEILSFKHAILKLYIENLKDTDEDLRLASQIIDYLE